MEALMQQDISELDMTEVQFSFLRRPFIQNMIPTDKVSTGNIRKFLELKDIPAFHIEKTSSRKSVKLRWSRGIVYKLANNVGNILLLSLGFTYTPSNPHTVVEKC